MGLDASGPCNRGVGPSGAQRQPLASISSLPTLKVSVQLKPFKGLSP